jgi:hypothetical protein
MHDLGDRRASLGSSSNDLRLSNKADCLALCGTLKWCPAQDELARRFFRHMEAKAPSFLTCPARQACHFSHFCAWPNAGLYQAGEGGGQSSHPATLGKLAGFFKSDE